METGLYNTFLAANVLFNTVKPGGSYTIASGGMAHITPAPSMWRVTVKNSAINGFVLGLGAEAKAKNVRVYSACIHIGVAVHGENKNQIGMDAVDNYDLGALLVNFTTISKPSGVVCFNSLADAKNVIV